jgi:hypothetical protein
MGKKSEGKKMLAKKLGYVDTSKLAHKEAVKKASAEIFKQYDKTFKRLSKS